MVDIDKSMSITEILEKYPSASEILMNVGMHCINCAASAFESLEEACMVHDLDPDVVVDELVSGLEFTE